MGNLTLSSIGKAVLIAREGRRLQAYRDSVGVWTIGIGCTRIDGRPVRLGDVITSAECDALFDKTVAQYVAAVNRGLTVAVAQNAFDALASICYNIGIGHGRPLKPGEKAGFLDASFLKRINAGDAAGAGSAILSWRFPPEIVDRRLAEQLQFLTPYAKALPKARIKDKGPVAAPMVVVAAAGGTPTMTATVPHPTAPAIEPVHLPPTRLERVGAWVDYVLAGTNIPAAYSGGRG